MKRENEIERDNRYQPFKGRDGDENDGEETWESEKWSTRPNTRFGVGKRNGGTIRLEVTGRRREEYEKRKGAELENRLLDLISPASHISVPI